ncbi:MAG: hypothetical protein NVSMB23_10940 [Myxococcales bacterium]
MRWTPGGESDDIEDRRGEGGGGGGGGFGGIGRLGLVGTVVVLGLSLVFHQNFFALLGGGDPGGQAPAGTSTGTAPSPARSQTPAEEREVQFVSFVLDDVQKTWARDLPKEGGVSYPHAKLVLFRGATRSGCGRAQEEMGPFYCPADRKVYIDLAFYDELRTRFGAPGEFAQAYVLAHEVGHHVQNLLGIERKFRAAQEAHPAEAKRLSVRMELQADCLAGIWAHSTAQRDLLERGDVESGLGAAAAVGDDRLQKKATGRVNPESFTHGSSQQRTAWFKRGFADGTLAGCDTFNQRDP